MTTVDQRKQDFFNKTFQNMREGFEGGNSRSLIYALKFCAEYKISMPDWVAKEVVRLSVDFLEFNVDVFGEDLPLKNTNLGITQSNGKKANIANLKKRKKYAKRVWFAAKEKEIELTKQGKQLNKNDLFEELSDELQLEGIYLGKTLVSDYYYYMQKILDNV